MFRKLVVALIVAALFLSLTSAVYADLSVGVKKGDWIEYAITTTGSPTAGHDITSSRMEVTDVQGTNITVFITSTFPNGTTETFNSILNLQTGHLIDDFIIPANLNVGDAFLDQTLGNITISSSEQHTYAGATRTVLSASTSKSTFVWDQATGVSVEATSQESDYTMHTIVKDTNMWQPPPGLDVTVLALIVVVVVIVVVAVVMVVLRFRKKKTPQQSAKT
jgi:hypothetical protein